MLTAHLSAAPRDGAFVAETCSALAAKYPSFRYTALGKSIEGREIPLLRIGKGKRAVLYVGTHHAMEWLTALWLLRFAEEVAAYADGEVCGTSVGYLLKSRTLYILPMLNPDGVYLQQNGTADEPLAERKRRMNGGSPDFTHWQANARGVDLNHNYDAGFAEYKAREQREGIDAGRTRYSGICPESEPETRALASLVRSLPLSAILTLHTQGEEIYAPIASAAARALARLCGYRYTVPDDPHAQSGGLSDWAAGVLGIPSFTVECGKGENPLPLSVFPSVYERIRPLLFRAPLYLP